MIDPGKLLGGLLGNSGALGTLGNLSGLGSPSSGGLPTKTAVGMGLLGVAMAAFEHFTENRNSTSTPPAGPGAPPFPPGMPAGSATPPPPPGGFATPTAGPPVPPSPAGMPTPPAGPGYAPPTAPPVPPASPSMVQADPVLLIRAMIASANADGELDDTERMRILGQLEGVGLTEEEKDFLCTEFNCPRSAHDIAAVVRTPAEAAQVFTVSLLAVDVDTQAERDYLDNLRQALDLSVEQAGSIARRLGRAWV